PEGVMAGIECDGSQEQVPFRWVVGCDGLHSITRQLAGIGLAGHDIPEPWAVFDATASGWPEAFDVNYAYLDEIPVIMTALPNRRWRVYLRPSSPESDLVVDAASIIGRYHPEVALNDISNPNRFHCHTKVATQFRSGPILLAGDAAHVCSPSQGHGMNSGVQDAFNLAWKLALVCGGDCSPELLDSYEAERRPVAEMITLSGDETERAHTLTDPAERRARDKMLRSVFADPASRHQEVIAEAELDIDYGDSPIVMGDTNEALNPGQPLPDTIHVRLASGEIGLLHDLTHRPGHTALLIGGSSSHPEDLARLDISLRSAGDPSLLEATIVATTHGDGHDGWARLDQGAADHLGVTGITLLAVRPDGYIGLRADRDHLEALATYQPMLGWCHSGAL
ncbi:MAG: FAD-dependent monooxygenase, partial [Acidimicrobiales bacterium]